MNFNCVFSECNFKQNNIKEEEFLKHLREKHQEELSYVARKEEIPIEMAEMITISNSKVFINS